MTSQPLGEFAFLAAEMCLEGQGYFLGRPGTIETYQDLIGASAASSGASVLAQAS